MSTAAYALARRLDGLESGLVSGSRRGEIIEVVRECWPSLACDLPDFNAAPAPSVVRAVHWSPPVLSFSAVEDRGFHDKLRHWTIDVARGIRSPGDAYQRVESEHVGRLADAITEAILEKRPDERLQWSASGSVRVLRRGLFPPAGAYTMDDRFERLFLAIRHRLGTRWRRVNGWWAFQAPQPTDPARLVSLIHERCEDRRILRHKDGRVRVVLKHAFPDEIGVTCARREEVARVLAASLVPLGWTLDSKGWWNPPPFHHGLGVCTECGMVAGPSYGASGRLDGTQRCVCDPLRGTEKRWGDLSMAAELCRCCGQVVLQSGSRFSIWFCRDCLEQVRLLNARLGRYALPIGRHSFHGGMGLKRDAGTVDVEILCSTWNGVVGAMSRLEEWGRRVVLGIIVERWESPAVRIPIDAYLARCVTTEEEKMRRFRDMMAFLAEPAGSAGPAGSSGSATGEANR